MKVVVYTLGCKVNQYESQAIINELKELGHDVDTELVPADLYILNTCAVTSEAEKKSRQMLSKIKKINEGAKVVVCGCSSQNSAEKFSSANGLVIGAVGKSDIVKMLEYKGILIKPLPKTYEKFLRAYQTRTRAFIKVQDGCNNFCSYCIVPYLRGRSRSREILDILNEIALLKSDVKEIVLTGINLSAYGIDMGLTLKDLILSLNSLNLRIRLGSLEVNVIDEEFLTACRSLKNFCPHFHLSLQSGSNSVLKKMNRHYTAEEYLNKVKLIREFFDDASITTDIIVGFPTESEQEFNETCKFCEKVAFSNMHVFPYSIRTGTVAAKMKQVENFEIKQRVKALTDIKKQLSIKFLNDYINTDIKVLLEEKDGEFFTGYTKNYIKVYILDNNIFANDIVDVKIKKIFKDGVLAEIKEI